MSDNKSLQNKLEDAFDKLIELTNHIHTLYIDAIKTNDNKVIELYKERQNRIYPDSIYQEIDVGDICDIIKFKVQQDDLNKFFSYLEKAHGRIVILNDNYAVDDFIGECGLIINKKGVCIDPEKYEVPDYIQFFIVIIENSSRKFLTEFNNIFYDKLDTTISCLKILGRFTNYYKERIYDLVNSFNVAKASCGKMLMIRELLRNGSLSKGIEAEKIMEVIIDLHVRNELVLEDAFKNIFTYCLSNKIHIFAKIIGIMMIHKNYWYYLKLYIKDPSQSDYYDVIKFISENLNSVGIGRWIHSYLENNDRTKYKRKRLIFYLMQGNVMNFLDKNKIIKINKYERIYKDIRGSLVTLLYNSVEKFPKDICNNIVKYVDIYSFKKMNKK
jgi:hypothetical protein